MRMMMIVKILEDKFLVSLTSPADHGTNHLAQEGIWFPIEGKIHTHKKWFS